MQHRLLLGLMTLGLLLGTARADENAKPATAREHFQRGTQLYELQRFDEAAHEYEAAYQLAKASPGAAAAPRARATSTPRARSSR